MTEQTQTKRKLRFTKWGLAENPVGLYCSLELGERVYLGEILAVRYDHTLGVNLLTIRHFNGELWPFQPRALAVNII